MEPRPLHALCSARPAWPLVRAEIDGCSRPVEVAPIDPAVGDRTLLALQVTDGSPLGAIARNTGGIRVDDGWIRVFGAGPHGLLAFNGWLDPSSADRVEPVLNGALVIGADAVGGFFVLDGAALGAPGQVFHLEPDTLELRSMGGGYSHWLGWALGGDLDAYYGALRWAGWRDEVRTLPPERGLHLYPPPYTAEGRDPSTVQRRPVPLAELWGLAFATRRQLGIG